jgi:hypothetical protein
MAVNQNSFVTAALALCHSASSLSGPRSALKVVRNPPRDAAPLPSSSYPPSSTSLLNRHAFDDRQAEDEVTVVARTFELLRELRCEHPAGVLLKAAALQQHAAHGAGAGTVLAIAAGLLRACDHLMIRRAIPSYEFYFPAHASADVKYNFLNENQEFARALYHTIPTFFANHQTNRVARTKRHSR